MRKESKFQKDLIDELHETFEGCIVGKTDSGYIQGFPDLIILWKDRWAVLEVKRSKDFKYQPNQEYYLDILNDHSFGRVIYPENKKEVLYDLQQAFLSRR